MQKRPGFRDILLPALFLSLFWCLGLSLSLPCLLDSMVAVLIIGVVPVLTIVLLVWFLLRNSLRMLSWVIPVTAVVLCALVLFMATPAPLLLLSFTLGSGFFSLLLRGNRALTLFLVILLLMVMVTRTEVGRVENGPRLLILGIDALDHEVLTDLIEREKLPALARLAGQGAFGPFATEQPMLSPILWTTIATGKGREEHGAGGFYSTSHHVRVKRIWDILQEKGWSVGVFRWLVTWPPPEYVDGFWVPDQMARDARSLPPGYGVINEYRGLVKGWIGGSNEGERPSDLIRYVWPVLELGVRGSTILRLAEQALSWLPDLPKSGEHRYLLMRRVEMEINCDLFLRLLTVTEPDFATFYDNSIDMVGHRYWGSSILEERSPGGTGRKSYGSAVTCAYVWTDAVIERILSGVSGSTHVAIVSDHGQRGVGEGTAGSWIVRGDRIVQALGMEDIAYVTALGVTSYLFPVRKKDEEQLGSLVSRELDRIRVAGAEKPLFEIRTVPETGLPFLALTVPELDGDEAVILDGEFVPLGRFVHRHFTMAAIHDSLGVLILSGPDVIPGTRIERAGIRDLVPTLLFREGLPVPRDMEGSVFTNVFEEKREIRTVPTFETETDDRPAPDIEIDPEIKNRLRDLGYLD